MKSEIGIDRQRKIKLPHRLLSMALCLIMVFSLCGTAVTYLIQAKEYEEGNTRQDVTENTPETREEIKARLMRQIRTEGWDPYSADMTLDEFYALMELFDERKLPLGSGFNTILSDSGMEGPSIDGEVNVIPRTMFMFSGLPTETADGKPFVYKEGDAPLPYNDDGSDPDYPAGLDPYGVGYKVPPTSWQGVSLGGKTQVIIAAKGQNDNDDSVAGNVVQSLFKDYKSDYSYYVRRVTAENNEATVLGAIKLDDKIVYYYLTDEQQSTDVSTTMLADGKKFIVEYSPIEHTLEYEVHMGTLNGADITNDKINVNVLGTDLTDTWKNIVFSTSRPNKTDGSAYSFTASAPYGYTVEFYLVKTTDEESGNDTGVKTWGTPSALLSVEANDQGNPTGSFKEVNGGWALGMEPDYKNGTKAEATIIPSSRGPSTLTMSGTIFNNGVHHDRKIIAVVHKNEDPFFLFAPLYHGTTNVNGRGASAKSSIYGKKKGTNDKIQIPYDFEDLYLWSKGESSRYDYYENSDSTGGASIGNIRDGNVAASNGSWNWDYASAPLAMTKDPTDGTYSYQWTWQSNSGNDGHTMDSLEVNGVAIIIPFYSKYEAGSTTPAAHKRWYTETVLPDGAKLLVEHLMTFSGGKQHVYRFTVTGARSNVTISAMNLMQGTGAPEFVTYQLTGVTNDSGLTAVEYFSKLNQWISTPQGNINVNTNANGIDFGGDNSINGASIRFKLADGYSSPYYLWEATKDGVISKQASAERDAEGNVILTDLNPVISLEGFSGTMDSEHVYGPDKDGWYYIRVTTQNNYKIALLTIGAKQVRYVVRYIPGIIPESERIPTGMPVFDHTGESDFEIPGSIADQYDTKGGAYYDVTVDNVIILPAATPSDPGSKYKFIDWVLVGENNEPVNDGTFHYSVTHINLIDVVDYAIQNDDLGGAATDIYVLRLMPTWEKIQNPLHYNVALNWVDAQGKLHTEYFTEGWKEVLTDWSIDTNGKLTVQVIPEATPFKDWIANHPTYIFWDEVNTNSALYKYYRDNKIDVGNATQEQKDEAHAAMSKEMEKAIQTYLPSLTAPDMKEQYDAVLEALCTRDISGTDSEGNPVKNGEKNGTEDFWRLGDYAYQVFEDYATIVVWMREDKGGLIFHEKVQSESYLPDEEFYYTVGGAMVGEDSKPLEGSYKAYPEKVYDEDGNERARLDSDAWIVTFAGGEIISIVKNDGSRASSTYFTLKNGEGIMLYVPAGIYSITEVGCQSGNPYQTSVTYASSNGSIEPSDSWILPDNGQLIGKETGKMTGQDGTQTGGVSQVTATIDFEIGEQNVVQTLTFANSTLSLRINCEVMAPSGHQLWDHTFGYQLAFTLPEGAEPPKDADGYYYNVIAYKKIAVNPDGSIQYETTPGTIRMTSETSTIARAFEDEDNVWYGVLDRNETAFKLQGSDYYVIILPAASNGTTSYAATETQPADGEQWHLDGNVYIREGELRIGVSVEETYVNTVNNPSLYITKTVKRSDGEKDTGSFTFTVTLSDTSYNEGIFTNGVATFTLKDGGSIFLSLEIPGDGTVSYTVTEAASSDYTITVPNNASGTFVDGTMITIPFVNTLIIPGPGYLVITETGGSPNESFLYRITDENGNELIVSVKGGGSTVVECPQGTYTIEEITDWAWRYEDGVCKGSKSVDVTIDAPKQAAHADFTNKRNSKVWLGGENSENNRFVGPAGSSGEQGSDSARREYALPIDDANEKKKRFSTGEDDARS